MFDPKTGELVKVFLLSTIFLVAMVQWDGKFLGNGGRDKPLVNGPISMISKTIHGYVIGIWQRVVAVVRPH